MAVLPRPRKNLFLEGLESLGGLGKTTAGFLREDDPAMSAFDLAGPVGMAAGRALPFGAGLLRAAARAPIKSNKAFTGQMWDSVSDFFSTDLMRRWERYTLENKGLQDVARGFALDPDVQDALQSNLKRMEFPDTFVLFRGRHKSSSIAEGFTNASLNEGTARKFRRVRNVPEKDWVVDRMVVDRKDIVGIGSIEEGELLIRTPHVSRITDQSTGAPFKGTVSSNRPRIVTGDAGSK